MDAYLESELDRRCTLFRLWRAPPAQRVDFLRAHADAIRALVGDPTVSADATTIDALPRLEIVAPYSAGPDKIDLDKCLERGIRVTFTPHPGTDDTADVALGLALAVSRSICAADRHVRSGAWRPSGEYGLSSKFSGKAVGIVGLGRIGAAIAKRAEAFGCPISYHSRSKKLNTSYRYYPDVVELAANSDVLFVSCALTDETRHIISRSVIDALGPTGVLVNVGRGAHVDEAELAAALLEGRLGGAGLDVFEREPEVPEELVGLDNVVLSPHVGSSTPETRKAMADLVLANLEAHVMKKPLSTPVL